MQDLPHERSLVKKLEGKPFAIVGVSCDSPGEGYAKLCEKNGVTWRSFMDGGQSGPINATWNVRKLPTIYVLDVKGVIRFKDVRGPKMIAAVEELVAEAEKEASAPAK